MTLNYCSAISAAEIDRQYSYDETDAMLYALSIGYGRDPLDEDELNFVYESDLAIVPTFATVPVLDTLHVPFSTGIDVAKLVHGEQKVEWFKPLPPNADLLMDTKIPALFDKGEGRGAVLISETTLRLASSNEPVARSTMTMFARGDGGFSKPEDNITGAPTTPHQLPERDPDQVAEVTTRRDQALLHRLCGDLHPLHANPAFARKVGFERPILHGLCTYGICCKQILESYCENDVTKLQSLQVRFSGPVLPGDTLKIEMWHDSSEVSFRAVSKDNNTTVIDNGLAILN